MITYKLTPRNVSKPGYICDFLFTGHIPIVSIFQRKSTSDLNCYVALSLDGTIPLQTAGLSMPGRSARGGSQWCLDRITLLTIMDYPFHGRLLTTMSLHCYPLLVWNKGTKSVPTRMSILRKRSPLI